MAIPTHNRRETVLLAALSSLRQTRSPHEVFILCDGCTDDTATAIRGLADPRTVVLELPKASGYAYGHRNRALELTKADVILWLGDDDLLLPDHLERLGQIWDDGTVDVVTSPAIIVHPDDTLEWIGSDWSAPAGRAWLERENTHVMSSVSVRTQLARDVGGWDAGQERAGDWDLWKRLLLAGARSADTGEPTMLHFRASRRDQPWPDRVIQNTRWLERVSAPSQLPELRRALRRARAEREATFAEAASRLGYIEGTRWWRLGEKILPLRRAFSRR